MHGEHAHATADKRAFPKNTEKRPSVGARGQEQEATNEEVSASRTCEKSCKKSCAEGEACMTGFTVYKLKLCKN